MGGVGFFNVLPALNTSMIRISKLLLVSILLTLLCVPASALEVKDTLLVYFHLRSSKLDLEYKDNGARAQEFIQKLRQYQEIEGVEFVGIEFVGTASPEGDESFNMSLAKRRQKAFVDYLKQYVEVPDSLITGKVVHEDWHNLADAVARDTVISDSHKKQIISVINSGDKNRIAQMNAIDEGKVYEYLHKNVFPEVRACRVLLVSLLPEQDVQVEKPVEVPPVAPVEAPEEMLVEQPEDTLVVEIPSEPEKTDTASVAVAPKKYINQLTFKINTMGLLMAIPNLAVEIDVAPHLSVSIPFYYSGGYDYFKETIKFRCIIVQPELRYYPWLRGGVNNGFFLGAHVGAGYYNFALDGDWRFQDRDGKRPAYGGGLSLGYSFRFKEESKWGMEFAIGGGVYDAEYDMFYNEHNGPYYKRGVHKLWYGVDNFSMSFIYMLDMKKKGGNK